MKEHEKERYNKSASEQKYTHININILKGTDKNKIIITLNPHGICDL